MLSAFLSLSLSLLFGLDKHSLVKGPALLQGRGQVPAEEDRPDVLDLRLPEPSDRKD